MITYFETGETLVWKRDEEPYGKPMTVSLKFLKENGRSGNKQTMVAADQRSGKKYFVKIIFRDPVESIYVEKESKVRFYSPFIVQIYGGMLCEERSCFITLMEYLPYEDLSSLVRNHRISADNELERLMVCHKIALKFLYGIDHYMSLYTSDPIVHRDLKPENVIASSDGSCVKIIDFDWVHLHDSSVTIMQKREQKGTPGYADPASWNQYICTKEMDIYSAGLVLYFLYTGKHHFYGNSEIQKYLNDEEYASTLKPMPGIDPEIVSIISHMIAKKGQRYEKIRDVIHDLESYLIRTGQKPALPEVLEETGEEDTIRFSYKVGDVKYSPYMQNYRFITIDFGRKQERSQNGVLSDTILKFYRYKDSIRYLILNEQCLKVSVSDDVICHEGDVFYYGGTEIKILQILSKKEVS